MELEYQPAKTRDGCRDHVRADAGQPSADHGDELVHARLGLVLARIHLDIFHPLDFVARNQAAFVHLATHADNELVGGFTSALVRLLGAEYGFGDERREVVERGGRKEGDERREKYRTVLRRDKSIRVSQEGRRSAMGEEDEDSPAWRR